MGAGWALCMKAGLPGRSLALRHWLASWLTGVGKSTMPHHFHYGPISKEILENPPGPKAEN